ncbi:hypothetical protein DFH28DRAFT_964461 [Melampsora americana]|nr:hypothetical protein DFH28DRAFT_964461 [Melampsora americana]
MKKYIVNFSSFLSVLSLASLISPTCEISHWSWANLWLHLPIKKMKSKLILHPSTLENLENETWIGCKIKVNG